MNFYVIPLQATPALSTEDEFKKLLAIELTAQEAADYLALYEKFLKRARHGIAMKGWPIAVSSAPHVVHPKPDATRNPFILIWPFLQQSKAYVVSEKAHPWLEYF